MRAIALDGVVPVAPESEPEPFQGYDVADIARRLQRGDSVDQPSLGDVISRVGQAANSAGLSVQDFAYAMNRLNESLSQSARGTEQAIQRYREHRPLTNPTVVMITGNISDPNTLEYVREQIMRETRETTRMMSSFSLDPRVEDQFNSEVLATLGRMRQLLDDCHRHPLSTVRVTDRIRSEWNAKLYRLTLLVRTYKAHYA